MKLKYIPILLTFVFLAISFSHKPAIASMPPQIRTCLQDRAQLVQPKQFREISKVRDSSAIYYLISFINDNNPFPPSTILVVKNGQCKNLGNPVLSTFAPFTDYVPKPIATFLAEARWRSVLRTKAGAQFIKSISVGSKKPAINETGELLEPIKLHPFDLSILRKLKVSI